MITINGEKIQTELFPNGESLIHTDVLNNLEEPFNINFSFYNNQDILELLFVLAHLDDIHQTNYDLYIHYMPYSRMDRNENGNCFSLKHICSLLNKFVVNACNVYIVEPHSDVTLKLLNAERINVITPLMKHILLKHPDINMICYPDKGAKQRFQDDEVELPVVYCEKIRDFNTGEIKGLELQGDIDLKDKNVLILDDLCSKGGTFYHTANKLHEAGANKVYLGVCHMEPTVRYGKIYKDKNVNVKSPIEHIYCFNTMLPEVEAQWLQELGENLTIYKIEKFLSDVHKFEEV